MTRDVPHVERAPAAEAGLGRPPAGAAAPELVGLHRHVDAARATLSAAWPNATPSSVPDVLAPGLTCVFCGINPGRVSAAAAAHFANPRNDFWRLLHDAGFTPRLFEPQEQFSLLELGYGVTNAAVSHDAGLGRPAARRLRPRRVRGADRRASRRAPSRSSARRRTAASINERPELGPQIRSRSVTTGLYVLPSTSPANAAVPYDERLRWFRALRDWLEPIERRGGARARPRCRRTACCSSGSGVRSATRRGGARPAAGSTPGRADEEALRRELREEIGLEAVRARPVPLRARRRSSRGRACSTASASDSISCASTRTSPRATIDLDAGGSRRGALVDARRSSTRRTSASRPTSFVERVRTLAP